MDRMYRVLVPTIVTPLWAYVLTQAYAQRAPDRIDFPPAAQIAKEKPFIWKGVEVSPLHFPGFLYSVSKDVSGREKIDCSATLIGPDTALTAAHCVLGKPGGRLVFRSLRHEPVMGKCVVPPGYDANVWNLDHALCKLDKSFTNVRFEWLAPQGKRIKHGDRLLLTGFGCTNSDLSGGSDGILRVGLGQVVKYPAADDEPQVAELGQKEKAVAAACLHDSGGAVFSLSNENDFRSGRIIVATIIAYEGNKRLVGRSFVTTTSTPQFQAFLADYLQKERGKVCGHTAGIERECCPSNEC